MKTLKALFLIALTTILVPTLAHAQERRSMADATHALKGPVRSFRTEIATFVLKDGNWVEGPRVVREEATFNTDGNRTDYRIYNNGTVVRRIEMKFDGRTMIECINYNGAGQPYLRIVNSFDDEKRIKETNTYNGDSSLRSKTTFKRNGKGQLMESTEYSAAGILMEQFNYKYEGEKVQSWERKIYNSNGVLQTTEIYIAPNRKDFISYRPDGSVIEKSVRIGQEVAHYNANGSLKKFTTISQPDRLTDELTINQKEPSKRESQIPDQTDSHGNWTRQTKWSTDANGTKPLVVTYRTITYYDN